MNENITTKDLLNLILGNQETPKNHRKQRNGT